MFNESYNRKPTIKKQQINILDGTWLIHKIYDNKLIIFRNTLLKRRVQFSKNIEVNRIKDNKIIKSVGNMNNYGKSPNKLVELYENYVYSIIRHGKINLSCEEFIKNLKILKLYYFFMSQLINTHFLLSTKGKKMLYSKKTLIKKPSLDNITKFIYQSTDLSKHINIIHKFYKEYCVK
tara:strand:+ start:1381 stop:1914 length:534 start_codon:yes stop_codon:yes gene_type:complete